MMKTPGGGKRREEDFDCWKLGGISGWGSSEVLRARRGIYLFPFVSCSVFHPATKNSSARVTSPGTAGTLHPSGVPALLPFVPESPGALPPFGELRCPREGQLWAPLVQQCQPCVAGEEGPLPRPLPACSPTGEGKWILSGVGKSACTAHKDRDFCGAPRAGRARSHRARWPASAWLSSPSAGTVSS